MISCLTAPSHYLNPYWLFINKIHCHSFEDSFKRDTPAIYNKKWLHNYLSKIWSIHQGKLHLLASSHCYGCKYTKFPQSNSVHKGLNCEGARDYFSYRCRLDSGHILINTRVWFSRIFALTCSPKELSPFSLLWMMTYIFSGKVFKMDTSL